MLKFGCLKHEGAVGFCESSEGGHVVTIDDGRVGTITYFLDTLIHEYAHALRWERPEPDRVDHDALWGSTYARLLQWAYDHRMWPR